MQPIASEEFKVNPIIDSPTSSQINDYLLTADALKLLTAREQTNQECQTQNDLAIAFACDLFLKEIRAAIEALERGEKL